ncbi:hypothetical protein LNKW23_47070 [Paralimibaculum aggregatum]|uniref:Ferric uptake regulation protein n=1 Tax=Paralimibaculum aggregatum TaxID=3036245 RepID=A0ABQ6LTT0_9RHOB|nr:Fur family transcriptional regulator [Limibaculum sp. NKW23]GMG85485.1 hypothetical protein LNKW23_47070 [Limibaculum sp. NKW23]
MREKGKMMQTAVLAVLRNHRRAVSAYELLRKFRRTRPALAPTTIYRALAALAERGQVHRVESLNAFVACRQEEEDHVSILSICDDCGAVEESVAPDLLAELSRVAGQSGFAVRRHVVEIHGRCASCSREVHP